MSRKLNILYLTPQRLFEDNTLLKLQWEGIRTLIPCFLKALYYGNVTVKLHEFDKIFTGIKNLADEDVITKVAPLWYYFTKVTHQSIGPRIGDFAERLSEDLINKGNLCRVIGRNIVIKDVLLELFGITRNWTNKIDFVIECKDSLAFIELRMSEHTGGKTAQGSLMEKFDKILDLIVQGNIKSVKPIKFVIAILFNEDHELLTENNYDKGRLNSLIRNYIMNKDHIWGRLEKLSQLGYKTCEGKNIHEPVIQSELETNRSVCLTKDGFNIYIKILFGEEFFREFTGLSLIELLEKFGDIIADDLWLMYSLTINELKVAKEFGRTNVMKVYELMRTDQELSNIRSEFRRMYISGNSGNTNITNYMEELNHLITELSNKILEVLEKKGEKIMLLETNDLTENYKYLKYVCVGALELYLTADILGDKEFKGCRWEETEDAEKVDKKKQRKRVAT